MNAGRKEGRERERERNERSEMLLAVLLRDLWLFRKSVLLIYGENCFLFSQTFLLSVILVQLNGILKSYKLWCSEYFAHFIVFINLILLVFVD